MCFPLQMAEIYDSSRGLVKIGPCKWSPNLDIAFWLAQDDDTILKVKKPEAIFHYFCVCSITVLHFIKWYDTDLYFFVLLSTCPPLQWLSHHTLSST